MVRENVGYDVGAFQAGVRAIGYETLKDYGELLIVNDSVFGPIYPLEELFGEMEEHRHPTLWGVSGHRCMKNRKLPLNPCGYMPAHIQSYFMAFRQEILRDPCFEEYWEGLPAIGSRKMAIERHETYVTRFFEEHGFSWDTYVPAAESAQSEDMLHAEAVRAISEFRCPFVKKNLFTPNTIFPLDMPEVYRAVAIQTLYDEAMIAEYAVSRFSCEDIIEAASFLAGRDDPEYQASIKLIKQFWAWKKLKKSKLLCWLWRCCKTVRNGKPKLFYHLCPAVIIRKSGWFDAVWYEKQYSVPQKEAARHYPEKGYRMGYDPSGLFSGERYLKENPDVMGMNPLIHYEVWGKWENRRLPVNPGLMRWKKDRQNQKRRRRMI